jgi:hypothetical protein
MSIAPSRASFSGPVRFQQGKPKKWESRASERTALTNFFWLSAKYAGNPIVEVGNVLLFAAFQAFWADFPG